MSRPQTIDGVVRRPESAGDFGELSSYLKIAGGGPRSWDAEGRIPGEVIDRLRSERLLAPFLPVEVGGLGSTTRFTGSLSQVVASVSPSLQSLLTVHGMVAASVSRWATASIKDAVLPALATGDSFGAFCLSEKGAGSDISAIETRAEIAEDAVTVTGEKQWVSFGLIADEFLTFCCSDAGPIAVLIPSSADGVRVTPSAKLFGFRSGMLATVTFDRCRVPRFRVLARPGFGLSHVAMSALTRGRFSVAAGALGLARRALQLATDHVSSRKQGATHLSDSQLVKRLLAKSYASVESAAMLVDRCAISIEHNAPSAARDAVLAKYMAAEAAVLSADSALQLFGANGLAADSEMEAILHDSRVFSIIEGSREVLEDLLGVIAVEAMSDV